MDFTVLAIWILKLFLMDKQKYYLIIDRTNGYRGKQKINVFMVLIASEALAISLFWNLLDKAGSSNFNEKKTID